MKCKLKIEKGFIDKNDETKEYKVGDVVEFEEARSNELLADSRKLVSLVAKLPEKNGKPKKDNQNKEGQEETNNEGAGENSQTEEFETDKKGEENITETEK